MGTTLFKIHKNSLTATSKFMKDIYLIANWKMNPATLKEAEQLSASISGGIKKIKPKKNINVVICPPYLYLKSVSHKSTQALQLGAQDCFWGKQGAYTGAVSAPMLKDIGCRYVILGHSERREYFGEDDALINKKVRAALLSGLRPVLAIGEKTRNTFDGRGRHTNELDTIIEEQLRGALKGISSAQAANLIIIYEPVWAISKGNPHHQTATSDDVLTAILFIRKVLANLYSKTLAKRIPVLYGGSTTSRNLRSFLDDGGADGALVGGASLKADEFIKMIKVCEA